MRSEFFEHVCFARPGQAGACGRNPAGTVPILATNSVHHSKQYKSSVTVTVVERDAPTEQHP